MFPRSAGSIFTDLVTFYKVTHCITKPFQFSRDTQNCMVMVEHSQLWVGSEDSVIYIINIHSMSCNKQLTDHRASITGLVVQDGPEAPRYAGLRRRRSRDHCGQSPAGARHGEGSRSGMRC